MKKRGVTNAPTAKVQDPILKTWRSHYNRLFLRDGLLVRSMGNRSPYPNYVIVVPSAVRDTILKAVHDIRNNSHRGKSEKTFLLAWYPC